MRSAGCAKEPRAPARADPPGRQRALGQRGARRQGHGGDRCRGSVLLSAGDPRPSCDRVAVAGRTAAGGAGSRSIPGPLRCSARRHQPRSGDRRGHHRRRERRRGHGADGEPVGPPAVDPNRGSSTGPTSRSRRRWATSKPRSTGSPVRSTIPRSPRRTSPSTRPWSPSPDRRGAWRSRWAGEPETFGRSSPLSMSQLRPCSKTRESTSIRSAPTPRS
jgi:hypothetical protein